MVRLLLVPHALTDWNEAGRFQGHADRPLSATGQQQTIWLAERLACVPIEVAYASDLKRASDTAATIAAARQLNFGAWEGLTYKELRNDHREALTAWEADALRTAPPGGETLGELAGRVSSFLAELTHETEQERRILVVAHRGSLQVLLCLALGLVPQARWHFRLEPASLSELELHPRGAVLVHLNDTYHLREAGHAS
jgi:broad specificity phosphatase PhoE